MTISGLQKMTLLDFPGKVACTVFLHGCNYRCPFCHNSELLEGRPEPLMTVEEFLAFLKKRAGLLDGVCVSGGEPTLSPDLRDLLVAIKELGYGVKLDTNGSRPAVLKALVAEGLVDYVAMDIKNAPSRYAQTCGVSKIDLAAIEESAAFLMQMIPHLSRRYQLSRSAMGVVLNSTKATGKFVVPYFHGETEEVVYLLCLDSKQKLISCRQIQRGSVNVVQLPIRKVIETALNANAVSVILAHNHPGGMALPSTEDYRATDLLIEALAPLQIPLLDHVIVAEGDYVSLRDDGYIRTP